MNITSGIFVIREIVVSHDGFHRSHIFDFGGVTTENLGPWRQLVRDISA